MVPVPFAGGAAGTRTIILLLTDMAVVLVLSLAASVIFSSRKAKQTGQKAWTPVTRRMLASLLLPLVAGGLFILITLSRVPANVTIASTLVFYGLAVIRPAPRLARHWLACWKWYRAYLPSPAAVVGIYLGSRFRGDPYFLRSVHASQIQGMKRILENFNKAFESRVRLGIMSALVVNSSMDFISLRDTLEVTDGNLASHLRALEEAGYISMEKSFINRKPNTKYSVTEEGMENFRRHIKALEDLINKK
jgi:DNA-binding MarR family transcriptional regulator